jgi:sec-independent protein translocase protein TatA
MILLLGMPGGPELILIAFIVLLLFGGKKLPELMKGLGKGIREFNNAKNSIQSEINTEMKEIEKPKIEIKEEVKVKKEEIKE